MKTLVTIIVIIAVAPSMMVLGGCSKKQEVQLQGAPPATTPSAGIDQTPNRQVPMTPSASEAKSTDTNADKTTSTSEEMASCPVLGTTMPKKDMIPYEYKGSRYYFCCQDCVVQFNKNPEKYIQHPAPPKPAGQGM